MSVERYKIGKNAVGNLQMKADAGKWAKVALAAVETAGGLLAWQNPESSQIIVDRFILNITAIDTANLIANFGVAADATTAGTNLLDGQGIKVAYSPIDNLVSGGAEGKSAVLVDEKGGTNDYITGSKESGEATGLTGYAYIHYRTV